MLRIRTSRGMQLAGVPLSHVSPVLLPLDSRRATGLWKSCSEPVLQRSFVVRDLALTAQLRVVRSLAANFPKSTTYKVVRRSAQAAQSSDEVLKFLYQIC